jgi:hypothetical protein
MGPWRPAPGADIVIVNGCTSGGGYRFTLPGVRTMNNPSRATLDLALPANGAGAITLVGIRAWASTRLAGSGVRPGAGIIVLSAARAETVASFEDARSALEPVVVTSLPPPAPALQIALVCEQSDRPAATSSLDSFCNLNDATPFELRGVEVTLREDVRPTGSAVGGTLLGDTPVSGIRGLDYSASDAQSGLARIEAIVDGIVVAARDLVGRCEYADFAACPLDDRDSMSIDTRNIADGRHALSLRIIDAAGNGNDLPVQSIDVRNSQALPTSPGLATADAAHLTAVFAGSSRSKLIVPFGGRATVRGRLTSTSLSGLAKATVDVFERVGAKEVAVGRAQTRSDGRFSYTLAARRPSRILRLAYGSIASSPPLEVRVRAAATFKATLRGTTVHFSGRVLSRPLPRAGKLVRLQGRAPGYAWAPFVALRTDRHGRFSGSYRLQARRPGVRLQIRARVPTERGYPYINYTGSPVTLRVR